MRELLGNGCRTHVYQGGGVRHRVQLHQRRVATGVVVRRKHPRPWYAAVVVVGKVLTVVSNMDVVYKVYRIVYCAVRVYFN